MNTEDKITSNLLQDITYQNCRVLYVHLGASESKEKANSVKTVDFGI